MLVIAIRLWEIPNRPLRLIIAAAAQDRGPCVLIVIFVGPLPHMPDHIFNTERARSIRMPTAIIRRPGIPARVGQGHRICTPIIPPRIDPAIRALGRILPFPFSWQTFARPSAKGSGILD
jgi:hypothetical protein